MHSNVVSASHHLEMKKKALEISLSEKRKEELDQADPKEKKQILKEIKEHVAQAMKDSPLRREVSGNCLIR